MPEAIVDLLEMVEVEHHHAGRLAAAGGPLHFQRQLLLDVGVLEQPGQAVARQRRAQRAGALGMGIHRGDQCVVADRFGDEVVAGLQQRRHLPLDVGFRGEVDDGHSQPLVMQADHLRKLRAGTAGHVHVEQQHLGVEAAHGVEQPGGLGEDLHLHLRVAQHQAIACRQLGIVVDDQHAEGFLLAVQAAFQAVLQLGDVQWPREEPLGAGTHRGELAGEVEVVVNHQEWQRSFQLLLQLRDPLELAVLLHADDQRIGQPGVDGVLQGREIAQVADQVAEVAQCQRHVGAGLGVRLQQVDTAGGWLLVRIFPGFQHRGLQRLAWRLARQLLDRAGQGLERSARGPGRFQPAIGALLQPSCALAERVEAEGAGGTGQPVQALAQRQHPLPAAVRGAAAAQLVGQAGEFGEIAVQPLGELLVEPFELLLQFEVGLVIHARPPRFRATGRPVAGGRKVCSAPAARRAGAARRAARAAGGR